LEAVVLLLLDVFVLEQAIGLAAAAHVHAHAGIAVAREIGMREGVALGGAVALAIGQELQDRRNGVRLGVLGQENPRGEPTAVGERNEYVLDLADAPREFSDDHGGNSAKA